MIIKTYILLCESIHSHSILLRNVQEIYKKTSSPSEHVKRTQKEKNIHRMKNATINKSRRPLLHHTIILNSSHLVPNQSTIYTLQTHITQNETCTLPQFTRLNKFINNSHFKTQIHIERNDSYSSPILQSPIIKSHHQY